jgi:DNA-binding transcriptional MerR regulator
MSLTRAFARTVGALTVEDDLAIKDVAERTGIAAGTIRMWEQRFGFPEPQRLPSGYRRYAPEDVDTLRRVRAHCQRALSVGAAIARAREAIDPATGDRLDALLADRPLALERPVPSLTALANRVVAYLER